MTTYLLYVRTRVGIMPLTSNSLFSVSSCLGITEPSLVELQRVENDSPLGIQIRTSRNRPGIFVHYLVPGSTAEENGQVFAGDRILEANGCDMRNASVDDAASFMTVREYLN